MTEYFFVLEDDGVPPACERVDTIADVWWFVAADKQERGTETNGEREYPIDSRLGKSRAALA